MAVKNELPKILDFEKGNILMYDDTKDDLKYMSFNVEPDDEVVNHKDFEK